MAVGLSELLVLELGFGSNITGPWWANYGLGLVVTAAVAWRRPWPIWALVGQVLAAGVSTAAGGDLTDNVVAPFLSVIVVMYAVGSYSPVEWGRVGLAIGVVGMVVIDLLGGHHAAG